MSSLSQFTCGSTPIGSICQAPYKLTDPAWLPCDGRAVSGNHYLLLNVDSTTVNLPAVPLSGDMVCVTVGNNISTNVISRNGNSIMETLDDRR